MFFAKDTAAGWQPQAERQHHHLPAQAGVHPTAGPVQGRGIRQVVYLVENLDDAVVYLVESFTRTQGQIGMHYVVFSMWT
ncbi:hypothetical protein [Streptomyces sp. NPDC046832]|uniref:hypothetical protein n=1 Tax=Streptomyces sp. NPDC046832 TaxID=3155020 RepID=UPI0033F8A09B